MISTGDLKKGVTIEFEGQLCSISNGNTLKWDAAAPLCV